MSELHEECGVAAVYHLEGPGSGPLYPDQGPDHVSRLIPRMLQEIQNRGQLAAGITSYSPTRPQLIDTHKDVGTVSEVFRLAHRRACEGLMREYAGRAAIGHVRYATCGADDRGYAQPFERHHIQKRKWFSFAFNGQLANYQQLRDDLLSDDDYHLARESDTEIIMHELGREMSGDLQPDPVTLMRNLSARFDGSYSLVMLNAEGEMLVARDPLGIKPICYAVQDGLFAAASESVALLNIGFSPDVIKSLPPGHLISIRGGQLRVEAFAASQRTAHCFFEWIYFANVASFLDGRSVYLSRTALGEELARLERETPLLEVDEDTIVVPVPDTSKAAADAMAYRLNVPSREGLIRNRYAGRTFIEGQDRERKAAAKYTPLREVLRGKKVLLVEDSIVRSTTMKVLLNRIREQGEAREVHVRVACPPIVAPCFYGIDMSTVNELFAPRFLGSSLQLTDDAQRRMAKKLNADSLRYLPVDSIARAIGLPPERLCQACITGKYPTGAGQDLYQIALGGTQGQEHVRTYESNRAASSVS